jgi:hypothetical protein
LSCTIYADREKKTTFVIDPHLTGGLEGKFGEELRKMSNFVTHGTPLFKITRPNVAENGRLKSAKK